MIVVFVDAVLGMFFCVHLDDLMCFPILFKLNMLGLLGDRCARTSHTMNNIA